MNRTNIAKCLTLCAAYKKNLKVDEMTIEAWFTALADIPDDIGLEAFGAMTRRKTFGDYEPAHVREEAEKIRQRKATEGPHLWISKAPSAPWGDHDGPVYERWAAAERQKLYRSCDSAGNVYLIPNPAAWAEIKNKDGTITKDKPKPIPTGERVQMQNGRPVIARAA